MVVIAFDIKGFFDNLDHTILKNSWRHALGLQENELLPKDHYNVFKAITKFSHVELEKIFDLFQKEMIVRRKSGD